MKIVIALACLVAFAAAVEETVQVDADLDGAENHYGGGGHRGGHGGGRGGHHGGGGRGRYGRSLEEAQPIMDEVDIFGYADLNGQDLEAAEHHYGGGYSRGGSAGYGNSGSQGYRGSGGSGYGRRGRRSVEENIEDLVAAEHHSGINYGRPSGSYGSQQHHSGGSSGYGHSGSSGHSGHGSQHHSGHGY